MSAMILTDAYKRGRYDAERGRARLFRSTRARGIVATADDPQSDEWTTDMRRAYLDGYDAAEAAQ